MDHSGARPIHGIRSTGVDSDYRKVCFSARGFEIGDSEMIRADVEYDVVDPDSQVTPTGEPVS